MSELETFRLKLVEVAGELKITANLLEGGGAAIDPARIVRAMRNIATLFTEMSEKLEGYIMEPKENATDQDQRHDH